MLNEKSPNQDQDNQNQQNHDVKAAQESDAVIDYLLHRRSVKLKKLTDPGPDDNQIETMLRAATRVPDHGKMCPWHFIVFNGEARRQAGKFLAAAYNDEEPDAKPAKLDLEGERFLRAPLVIAVVSRVKEGKKPLWEQILSAGAACQNLCLAANALGFGTQWVTEWYAYNESFRKSLGLDDRDNIAGFIYIGTPEAMPEDRDRPALQDVVTHWQPGVALNKGDEYGHPGKGLPDKGFDFEKMK